MLFPIGRKLGVLYPLSEMAARPATFAVSIMYLKNRDFYHSNRH
jgi:hypothetical protein